MGNCFRCYFRQLFISLAFIKCKKDSYILKIILVQGFVHLKLKLRDFLSDFVLKVLHRTALEGADLAGGRWIGWLATPLLEKQNIKKNENG